RAGNGQCGRRREEQEIVAHGNRAQSENRFSVITAPPLGKEQRSKGDGGEQQPERQHHAWIGSVPHASKLGGLLGWSNTFEGWSGRSHVDFPPVIGYLEARTITRVVLE